MQLSTWVLFIGGWAVYALVMWDVLVTTISLHGGGPLTNVLIRLARKFITQPPAGEGDGGAKFSAFWTRYSALILTVVLFATWFVGLTVGLTLLFAAEPGSVVHASSGQPVGIVERLYFVSASVTTAGFGDFVPKTDVWRGYTILTAASGLVVTSLGISYVISLVGAVLTQRKIARRIVSMGVTPRNILAGYYDGESFAAFGANLPGLAEDILGHVQSHLAYPMIHYVRARDDRDCIPAALALLDETLTILLYNVPADKLPDLGELVVLRNAISAYLESLRDIYLDAADHHPDWPDLTFLMTAWEIVPEQRERAVSDGEREALRRRRALLNAAVRSQGLEWGGVAASLREQAAEALDADLLPLLARGVADPEALRHG